MTVPTRSLSEDAGADAPALGDLLRDLELLTRRARDLVEVPTVDPADALRRCAEGRGTREDEDVLGGLEGCRLVQVVPARSGSAGSASARSGAARSAPVAADLSVDLRDGAVLHLVRPRPARTGADSALDRARVLAAAVRRYLPDAAVGISRRVGAGRLAEAAADARDAAALAGRAAGEDGTVEGGLDGVVEADTAWAPLALARWRGRLTAGSPLERLRAHDREHGTELVRTLAVWLRPGRSTGAAAAALHVHPNTLRYRVAKASDVAGLDLDDADQCLVLALLLALEV